MSSSSDDSEEFKPLFFQGSTDTPGSAPEKARLYSVLLKAVEDASEAIIVTERQLDPPGPRILWANPAFTEITGYSRSEAIGNTPRILQGPETESSVLRRLRKRLQAGERFEGEAVNYRKDGSTYINHWSIAPVRDEDGAIAYWVSIQRDVTDKRRLQQEVLRAQEEERRRIGRKLHDSVGSDLVSAGMLLDNVLDQHQENDVLVERLQNVRAAIRRGYSELRDLTQGLSPVDLSEGSLTIALENLVSRCPDVHLDRGTIDLDRMLADWDVEALGHLYRIVKEATANALQHAEADSIVIRISRDDQSLIFSVEDNGRGFVSEKAKGEGSGLRSMRYRADLLNADLNIASQSGEGTRVTCRLLL